MGRLERSLGFSSAVLWLAGALGGCSDEEPAGRASGGAGGASATSSTSSSSSGSTVTSASSGGAGGASTTAGSSGGGGASSGAGGSAGGSTGTGGAPEDAAVPCVVGTGPASLPFAVDKYFVASGWMQPALIHQDTTCTYPPPPPSDAGVADSDAAAVADGGAGDAPNAADAPITTASDATPPLADTKCWTVTYTPTGPGDWAGVDWQYPVNNWGDGAGLVIPAGAAQVSFVAWGDAGGEKVSFNVGYGPSSNDRFGASAADRFLTTTPTRYAIDLAGIAYTCPGVRMGFGWVAAGGTAFTFHIADIRWE